MGASEYVGAIVMTNAPAGWIEIAGAAIWAVLSLRAALARRSGASPERGIWAESWQRCLVVAAVQLATGIWLVSRSSPRQAPGAMLWIITAACGAVLVWMVATDMGPWLRARLRNRPSGREF
jgi:hypothetical protein